MQREKASSWEAADPPAVVAPPGPLDGGLPPNAAAGRTRLAAAMTAAVRIVGGHARRGGRMARVLSFIMPSSGSDDRGDRRRRVSAWTTRSVVVAFAGAVAGRLKGR